MPNGACRLKLAIVQFSIRYPIATEAELEDARAKTERDQLKFERQLAKDVDKQQSHEIEKLAQELRELEDELDEDLGQIARRFGIVLTSMEQTQ